MAIGLRAFRAGPRAHSGSFRVRSLEVFHTLAQPAIFFGRGYSLWHCCVLRRGSAVVLRLSVGVWSAFFRVKSLPRSRDGCTHRLHTSRGQSCYPGLTIGSSDRGSRLPWAREGVDDWDQVPSFDAGEAPRRSTSSLDPGFCASRALCL
jgi:hypothetical protein